MKRRTWARNAAELAAVILFEWIVQCFSLPAALAGVRKLGSLAFRLSKYRARACRQLSEAFPDWPPDRVEAVAGRCFGSLASTLVEALRLPRRRLNPEQLAEFVEVTLDPESMRAVRSGQGVLFVTAHLGNWELAPWALNIHGIPIVSVARPLENPLLDERALKIRHRQGQRVLSKRGALLGISRSLKEGLPVGLVVDQDARQEGIFVPFFGKLASTYDSVAAMALRYRCPIVSGYVVRQKRPGTFLAVMDAPIPGDNLPADPEAAKRELTARMNLRIESYVRQYPDQWIWHYNRWKTRPPEESVGAQARPNR